MQTENSFFAPFAIHSPSPSARFVGNSVSPVSTRAGEVDRGGGGTILLLHPINLEEG